MNVPHRFTVTLEHHGVEQRASGLVITGELFVEATAAKNHDSGWSEKKRQLERLGFVVTSAKPPKLVEITVNGGLHRVNPEGLFYADIVGLAGLDIECETYSMTERHGNLNGRIIHAGELVDAQDGTVFNVCDTSNA